MTWLGTEAWVSSHDHPVSWCLNRRLLGHSECCALCLSESLYFI